MPFINKGTANGIIQVSVETPGTFPFTVGAWWADEEIDST